MGTEVYDQTPLRNSKIFSRDSLNCFSSLMLITIPNITIFGATSDLFLLRSSHLHVSYRITTLKNFTNFTEKHPRGSAFLVKL